MLLFTVDLKIGSLLLLSVLGTEFGRGGAVFFSKQPDEVALRGKTQRVCNAGAGIICVQQNIFCGF